MDADALRKSARSAYKAGRYPAAAEAYDLLFARADGATPAEVEAKDRQDQGVALIRCGRVAEGAEALERGVALLPGDVGLRVRLGRTLSRLERHEAAAEQFGAAIALEPEEADHRAALGGELRWLGRPADARAELEHALRLDPEHTDARLTLLALGHRGEAGDAGLPPEPYTLESDATVAAAGPPPGRRGAKPVALPWLMLQALVLVGVCLWLRTLMG